MPDFVHSIHTHPDLVCICGHKLLFNELDRVLLLENSPSAQLLSYDTTFQLGDFYLSVLSFRHVLFEECPTIPVGFVFHERKYQSVHDQFFDICCKLAPSLKNTTKPIVTDEKQAIINAIASHLQSSTNLRYWNHIFRDAMRWLRAHGPPSADVGIYLSDVKDLFHLSSQEEYQAEMLQMAQKWSAPFYQYYCNHIAPDIASIARWALEPLGIYNPYSGITNNQAEGLNYVLKQLV